MKGKELLEILQNLSEADLDKTISIFAKVPSRKSKGYRTICLNDVTVNDNQKYISVFYLDAEE